MMDSSAVDEIDKENKSSSSSSKVSRIYPPLSFYMDSDVDYHGRIFKGNKFSSSVSKKNCIPLSFYNTTVVYYPSLSKMDIFVSNEEETPLLLRRYHPLSFYFYTDSTVPIPPGLRVNYIPLSSMPPSTATATATVSNSSQSKVSFPCFGSHSSQSKSVANIVFGSFASQSSPSKEQSSKSKVSKNFIPDDVAFSILSKLSIKSLTRFRCVCKSWSILFENTYFITMYSKHFISRHGSDHDYHTFILANHVADDGLYHSQFHLLNNRLKLNLPSPLQPSGNGTCILGSTSVNGIFCIGQRIPSIHCRYVLWNPLTEEFKVVPLSPAELIPKHPRDDNTYLEHFFHGFGYDQLTDDFKVIQYVSFASCHTCNGIYLPTGFFEIYSLKNNSWRMIHMDKDMRHHAFNVHASPFNGLEVYVDGACHWLVSRFENRLHAMTLLSFDLSDEVFLTTPIGEETYSSPYYHHHHLTVLNGSIALISNYYDDIVFHISILGELGVSESWIKLYIYGPLPSIQWPPIGFGKMGYMFVQKKDYEVAYVDLSTQIIEEVGIITGGLRYCFNIGLYKESLRRIK